jgi:hypothetical protein
VRPNFLSLSLARPRRILSAAIAIIGPLFAGVLCGDDAVADGPGAETNRGNQQVTFDTDIQPLLTRFGCNSGPCHGKSKGQNGFALSLLGFDSDFDYASIVLDARGRRLQFSSPENSLLLRKATGQDFHVGGSRFELTSNHYQLILDWIAQGAPRTPDDAARLVRVRLEPSQQSLAPGQSVQIKVMADYSDGTSRDVTEATAFESNDVNIARVSSQGAATAGKYPGETALMARYMNHIAVCSVTIPLQSSLEDSAFVGGQAANPIDDLVLEKLRLLGIPPSEPAPPWTVLRRTYLRIIGRLPTAEESQRFLDDPRPLADKRQELVDELLQRPEYADFWANKWADLLRPNPYRVGMKAVYNLDSWLRTAFRENVPYDQFVRELVTAQGSTWKSGATVIYRDRPQTVEIASAVSQLFLGIRLECAKCHHHPFEVWSQDDFYGFAAFFSRVGRKGTGLSPPISGGEEMIFNASSGSLRHERTGEVVNPKILAGETIELGAEEDPREILAAWMTSSTNAYFPRVMANRVWGELMSVGLVDPVDDLRATNPASNEALLDFLSEDFRRHAYDIKHLIRRIALSDTFARSSLPNEWNSMDNRNYSRYYRQRIRAEVLLDAVNDALEREEKFAAMPPGSRAMQLWTHRSPSVFLDTFGRPDENLDPPYERSHELTTPQILHLMNSASLEEKIRGDDGLVSRLVTSDWPSGQIIEWLYLTFYSRRPAEAELAKGLSIFPAEDERPSRRVAIEDLAWALINAPEFYFVD